MIDKDIRQILDAHIDQAVEIYSDPGDKFGYFLRVDDGRKLVYFTWHSGEIFDTLEDAMRFAVATA